MSSKPRGSTWPLVDVDENNTTDAITTTENAPSQSPPPRTAPTPPLESPEYKLKPENSNSPLIGTKVNYKKPSLGGKLGSWAVFVLFGGLLIILASCGFLAFLWFADERNKRWVLLMTSTWVTRSVTLAALSLRWAISLQAGVCTAMLASIALERGEIAIPQAAGLSTMRHTTAGPHNLAVNYFRFGTQMGGFAMMLAVPLVITTGAAQFASTILLSDFKTRMILNGTQRAALPYGAPQVDYQLASTYGTTDYLKSRPLFYPTFAEYREEIKEELPESIHSTGLTLRAFLPFGDSTARNRLSTYQGKATVWDASVTCVRPDVEFDVTLGDSAAFIMALNGTIKVPDQDKVPNLGKTDEKVDGPFLANAAIPTPEDLIGTDRAQSADWAVTVTQLGEFNGLDSPAFRFVDRAYTVSNGGGGLQRKVAFGPSFLVINTTGSVWPDALYNVQYYKRINSNSSTSKRDDKEWTRYTFEPVIQKNTASNETYKAKAELAFSVCYAQLSSTNGDVVAKSQGSRSEATLGWDVNTRRFNTAAIRKRLELGSQSESVRNSSGFVQLSPAQKTWNESTPVHYFRPTYPLLDYAVRSFQKNTTYLFCSHCQSYLYNTMNQVTKFLTIPTSAFHAANVALFQDTLRATSRPAIALQSLFTTVLSSTYYDQLTAFSLSEVAEYAIYSSVIGPGKEFIGFIAVMAVTALHIILVAIVLIFFQRWSRYSLLGNAWQTVAQTACLEEFLKADRDLGAVRAALFDTSLMANDADVVEDLKALDSANETVVILAPIEGTSMVGLRPRMRQKYTRSSDEEEA